MKLITKPSVLDEATIQAEKADALARRDRAQQIAIQAQAEANIYNGAAQQCDKFLEMLVVKIVPETT